MLYCHVAGNAFGFFQTVIVKQMFHFVIVDSRRQDQKLSSKVASVNITGTKNWNKLLSFFPTFTGSNVKFLITI